MGVCDIGIVE